MASLSSLSRSLSFSLSFFPRSFIIYAKLSSFVSRRPGTTISHHRTCTAHITSNSLSRTPPDLRRRTAAQTPAATGGGTARPPRDAPAAPPIPGGKVRPQAARPEAAVGPGTGHPRPDRRPDEQRADAAARAVSAPKPRTASNV